MHAEELCHKWLSNVLPGMHRSRLSALCIVVGAALRGGKLSVTALGRSIRGEAKTKHSIKRADRLFSNIHLQSERQNIYRCLCHQILGSHRQPVILVDWSDVDARREFFLLRAAVAVRGRSLTLYEEVHTRETRERRRTHNTFLENLKTMLPQNCRPIIVTDAGFRTPWFQKIQSLEWDFVGRVRNVEMTLLSPKTGWIRAKSLYDQAKIKAREFENILLTRSNPLRCSLILYKGRTKGRKRLTKMGRKARNRTSLVNSVRAQEPWLLATSLSATAPQDIVQIYSTRMQIEESFRDLKCPRFGLGLYHNGTYKLQRMKVLVMIGSLANTFAWILGKIARSMKAHRQFQANTTFSTPVLSNAFIGVQIFRLSNLKIPWRHFKKQIAIGKLIEINTN